LGLLAAPCQERIFAMDTVCSSSGAFTRTVNPPSFLAIFGWFPVSNVGDSFQARGWGRSLSRPTGVGRPKGLE
jgi:hypothetical protein